MPIGGFGGPSGRGVRSVERALSASTLLPTVAFAALGTLTILLVAQMGISPLGPVGAPSAHDGGQSVTTPRMSIIHPQRLHRSGPARARDITTADGPTGPTGPTTLTLARPKAHANPPTRGRGTTSADAPTGPTTLTFARPKAHANRPTRDRASTTPDAQSAAMTAAVTSVAVSKEAVTKEAVTNAAVTKEAVTKEAVTKEAVTKEAVTNAAVIGRTATTWEVTAAAVEPQVRADTNTLVASEVTYTLLARAATGPALEPEDQRRSQNEGTSAKPVNTPRHTDTGQASEHAKAAKSDS